MEHIAILREPFFSDLINGSKTIESRWSKNKIAPFGKVHDGDTVYIKKTGQDITAVGIVKRVEYYNLTPELAEDIRQKYGKEIETYKFSNWEDIRLKNYCTLIWFYSIEKIESKKCKKSFGNGWLVL